VAVRYLCANTHPDHDSICTFRTNNEPAFRAAFVRVLELAKELRVAKLGTVSVDGTKIQAHASKHAAVSYARAGELIAQLEREVEQLLQRAQHAEAQEASEGLDIPAERVALAFRGFEGPPMRLKPMRKGSLLVLNDTYNANPGSMESAIKTFSVLPARGRKVVVLGDMLELGEQAMNLHEKVGELAPCYLAGAKKRESVSSRMVAFTNTAEALRALPGMLKADDSILVKGSRRMGLEKLVDACLASGL